MKKFQEIEVLANQIKQQTVFKSASVVLFTPFFQGFVDNLPVVSTVSFANLGGFFADNMIELSLRKFNGQEIYFCGALSVYHNIDDLQKFTAGIRLLKLLGFKETYFVVCAESLDSSIEINQPLLISDHINLTSFNPLIGANEEKFGLRFPDMSEAYDRLIVQKNAQKLRDAGFEDRRVIAAVVTSDTICEDDMTMVKSGAVIKISSAAAEIITAVHSKMSCSAVAFVASPNDVQASQKLIFNKLNAIGFGV